MADDDTELDGEVMLDEVGTEDVPPVVELLRNNVELTIDAVAEVKVIVEVVVTIELTIRDGAYEDPALDELEALVANKLNDEKVGLVFGVLDDDRALELDIEPDVLGPDEVVRLVDIAEDKGVLVEDEELKLLADTIELVEVDRGVLEDAVGLLAVLELCVEEMLIVLGTVVDVDSVDPLKLVMLERIVELVPEDRTVPDTAPVVDETVKLSVGAKVDELVELVVDTRLDEFVELEDIPREVEDF